MVIYEDTEKVAIATFNSHNRKTGNQIQIWILNRNENPITALKTGSDSVVCGDCKHRNTSCYVNVAFGPNNIFKKYKRNEYPKFNIKKFFNEDVRFGAYGDPALLPVALVEKIANASNSWTGYTHQWETCDPIFQNYFMASTDSLYETKLAQSKGWSTFRVLSSTDEPEVFERECLAEQGFTCKQCKRCDSLHGNQFIRVHGAKHKIIKFDALQKDIA